MLRPLIYVLIFSIGLICGDTKGLNKPVIRDASSINTQNIGTSYDYDYFVPESRRASQRYGATSSYRTTERPFIRYWNNLVRNIRVPVPTITWNMTNPFLNLFNADASNNIDTPVANYYDGNYNGNDGNTNSKRKRNKNTRKQSNTKYSKKRKHRYEQSTSNNRYEELQQTNHFNDNHRKPKPYYDLNTRPMYFYDTKTGQYYRMQNLPEQYPAAEYVPNEQQAHQHPHQDTIEEEAHEGENEQVEREENEQEPAELEEQPEANEVVGMEQMQPEESIESPEHDVEQLIENAAEENLLREPEESVENDLIVVSSNAENDEDSKEEDEVRMLTKQANKKVNLHRSKNQNFESWRNSMNAFKTTHNQIGKKRAQTNTKQKRKHFTNRLKSPFEQKFIYYVLQ